MEADACRIACVGHPPLLAHSHFRLPVNVMFLPAIRLTTPSHLRSPLRILVLPLAVLVVVAGGCDSIGSGPPSTDTTLEPGGSARTKGGVRLLAPQEAIEKSVAVVGEAAPEAGDTTPLPEGTSAAGDAYQISGGRDIDLGSSDSPIYYALPVNQDADSEQLALGVRVPRSMTTDRAESTSSEYGWSVVPGAYEPERGLLVVPTPFLVKDGMKMVTLEDPTYSTPSMAGTEGETLFHKTKNFFSKNKSARTKVDQPPSNQKNASKAPPGFKIKCKGFDNSSECGTDEKNDVRSYLKEAYRDYVSDFREPDLPSPLLGNRLKWKIKKDGSSWCKNVNGKYLSLTNVAITCYNGKGDPSKTTTRHEFFHAIQYNYARISWDKLPEKRPDWLVEGTAAFAGDPNSSATKAHRSGEWRLRRVTRHLRMVSGRPHLPEYRVQDFWIYLINSHGSTSANILDPVFKSNADVPVRVVVDQEYSIADDHWGWARNQAVEARVRTGNPRLNDQCVFDERAASSIKTISYTLDTGDSINQTIEIDPLIAKVVKVRLRNQGPIDEFLRGVVKAKTSADDAYVKAYGNPSNSTTDCLNGDGQSSSASIGRSPAYEESEVVYLLLSNSGINQGAVRFDLSITTEQL